MKLIVLGSGTSVPHAQRSSSGFWCETSGGSILLDCSPSVIHRMAEESLDWAALDAIWISHFHLDHCGGLTPFLFGIKHAPDTRDRQKPLRLAGPPGMRKYIEAIDAAGNYGLLDQRFPVDVVELEQLTPTTLFDGVTMTTLKTPHTDESHAVRIDDGEISLVFTADTGFATELSTFANGIDLFVLECSFIKNKPVEKHLELAEAMHLVRRAKPKRAMLTHFYPEWDDVDFDAEVKRLEPLCNVIEAKDGLILDLSK